MQSNDIDCQGLAKEAVLAHLYNNAKPLQMGYIDAFAVAMTTAEASDHLQQTDYFEYLNGRPMKLSFENFPMICAHGYDRDQGGDGTAARLIKQLKCTGIVSDAVLFEEKSAQEIEQIRKDSVLHIVPIKLLPQEKLPQDRSYGGHCLNEFPKLKQFHTVYFTKEFSNKLSSDGIPYAEDWHVFMGLDIGGSYKFTGSMGGHFTVAPHTQCVKSTGHEMGVF
jgi:hypothetical protein